jgi:hypothetical protein
MAWRPSHRPCADRRLCAVNASAFLSCRRLDEVGTSRPTLVTDDATHAPCNQLGTAAVVGSMLATIAVANSEDGHALVRALSRILFDQRRRAGRRAWWRTVYYYSIRLSGQAWDSN